MSKEPKLPPMPEPDIEFDGEDAVYGYSDKQTQAYALAAIELNSVAWSYCPECGCESYSRSIYAIGQFCDHCGQEWFPHIDYTDVVKKRLGKLHELEKKESEHGWELKGLSRAIERAVLAAIELNRPNRGEPKAWMNPRNDAVIDARKKAQIGVGSGYPNFSIPLYPPAQSAPQAPQAAPTVPTNATGEKDYEHRHAVMQGECIAACDEYFEARPQIDNGDRRRIFEAGFERGYKRGADQAPQTAPLVLEGGTLADRLDAMADACEAGSQQQSDLYAAATIWRKHLAVLGTFPELFEKAQEQKND